ncbi:hypothetical protein HY948_01450 [Candidatus Gottesmanbacteria bacterium]|nr:hypothetical protein [Candidatus Gottesmanbacteria bacterium]
MLPILVPAVIWSLIWKGTALYKAARNGQKGWFVTLLILNTMGLLEIIYILFFSSVTPLKKKRKK